MFEFITAIVTLIVEGDYTGTLAGYGIEEDHPVVNFILTITGR